MTIRTIIRLCLMALPAWAGAAENEPLSFSRSIQPVLADACFTCHGQDAEARKSGLRLDQREGALVGGESELSAIVPGAPDKSEFIARIETSNEDDVMPPPDSGKTLTAGQRELLRRWIEEGADYEKHWSFTAPQRPLVPDMGASDASVPHAVDAFVSARLAVEKLEPSREASSEALLRRVSLDLIGLPPSLAEIDGFVRAYGDEDGNAYENLVQRLLASPRFGEKWSRPWLDAARYADSDGYEKDLPRSQWPWRDWVINAFNADMPYDQFIIEQIAGDLMPGATQDQRIATGFLRNGMVNEEGAILAEEFRMEGMFDRMDCIGKSVLGITTQCAQCHSHKFDPLTQEEYYRAFAFINDTYEAKASVFTAEQLEKIARIKSETVRLEDNLKAEQSGWERRLEEWATAQRANVVTWEVVEPLVHEWGGGLSHPRALPDHSVLTLGFRGSSGELWVETGAIDPADLTGLRLEAMTHGDLDFNGPGRSITGGFAISELEVWFRPEGGGDEWTPVKLADASSDREEEPRKMAPPFRKGDDDERETGPSKFLIDGDEKTAWGPDRGPGRRNVESQWVGRFAGDTVWPTGAVELRIMQKYRHAGADGHGRHNQLLGRFRYAVTRDPAPSADALPPLARQAVGLAPERRSPDQQAALFTTWRRSVAAFSEINARIEALWKTFPETPTTVLLLAERDREFHRGTHVLARGDWSKPIGTVTPGVPDFLHPMPDGAPMNRLGFARWLVSRNAPTTARVFVNRVWQTIFGTGLVETTEDFGVRAPLPSHPDLLDWLAVEFMEGENGGEPWSLKHLLRVIVTSETYRRDSRADPALLARDPKNRLLARGPRIRADAEVVRDIALTAAGLIHHELGGPSFRPPVPENLLKVNFVVIDWEPAPAPERYRRSLYMFRRRSMPDPVMAGFDAPNGDVSCVRRVRSNTPLAALTSLNEPVFIEAARALALRMLRHGGATDAARVAHGFRLCTARLPGEAETADVLELLDAQRQRIAAGMLAPGEILSGGDGPSPDIRPDEMDEAAALTIIARVLLNLDETISKN